MNVAPLSFRHSYSTALWGGRWMKSLYGRADAPEMIQGTAQCTRREIRAYFGDEK